MAAAISSYECYNGTAGTKAPQGKEGSGVVNFVCLCICVFVVVGDHFDSNHSCTNYQEDSPEAWRCNHQDRCSMKVWYFLVMEPAWNSPPFTERPICTLSNKLAACNLFQNQSNYLVCPREKPKEGSPPQKDCVHSWLRSVLLGVLQRRSSCLSQKNCHVLRGYCSARVVGWINFSPPQSPFNPFLSGMYHIVM